MSLRQAFSVFCLCVAATAASAQIMTETLLSGQVLTTTKQGKVTACGVRIVGIPQNAVGPKVRMFDGSLNVSAIGHGVGKIIVSEGPLSPPDPSKMKPIRVLDVWMKAPGKTAAAPVSGLIPGETPMSFLFVTPHEPALEALKAIVLNETIQVGIKTQVGVETIYFGQVTLTQPEREQYIACMTELAK